MRIDKIDLKILHELDVSGRMPINQLAKKVRKSREVTTYRLKKLQQLEVISGFHTVYDIDILGYRSFRLLLRLFNLSQSQKRELIAHFKQHPNTWWVAEVGGRWDIIMNFIAKDAAHFNEIFEGIVSRFGSYLQDYETLIYINIHDYPRHYILDSKITEKSFFHAMRYRSGVSIDKVDMRVMQIISNDARLSYTEIGERLDLTRNAVKYRIKNLEKQDIILGYRASYNPSKLGYNSYLLLLNINNLKKQREAELIEFAKQNPYIVFVVKHIGRYRITFECEVEDEKKFHALLSDIRDRFNDILTDFDFVPIFFDHKLNYFPLEKIETK